MSALIVQNMMTDINVQNSVQSASLSLSMSSCFIALCRLL